MDSVLSGCIGAQGVPWNCLFSAMEQTITSYYRAKLTMCVTEGLSLSPGVLGDSGEAAVSLQELK